MAFSFEQVVLRGQDKPNDTNTQNLFTDYDYSRINLAAAMRGRTQYLELQGYETINKLR